MRYVHAIAGALLLIVWPLSSRVFGSGTFAWTMYAGSGEYRIDIRVKDAGGVWHSVAPTGLADQSTHATAGFLVGADHFRRGPSLVVLRSHLEELAAFACRQRMGTEADVALHERRDADDTDHLTSAHAECH